MFTLAIMQFLMHTLASFYSFSIALLSRLDMDYMSFYCVMFMLLICSHLDNKYIASWSCDRTSHPSFHTGSVDGAPSMVSTWQEIVPYLDVSTLNGVKVYNNNSKFTYHYHALMVHPADIVTRYLILIAVSMPVPLLALKLSAAQLLEVSKCHGFMIEVRTRVCHYVITLFRSC